ncbi:DUF2917 domain-containing protein [Comamonas sp. JC664]|uniref:DUF2917 domain-containing protein n=1 Tax=Comamonas sp. JC664 TaxID=2801917 RepID=UPI003620AA4A
MSCSVCWLHRCAHCACQPRCLGRCRDAHSATGKAVSFVPQRDVVLRISEGTAWVTLGLGLSNEASLQAGDLVLHDGHTVVLKAGQSVVIESKRQDALVYTSQEPGRPANWMAARTLVHALQWGKTDGSMLYNL